MCIYKISIDIIYVGYIILIWYVDAFLQHQSREINLVIVASHRHPVDPGSLSSHNSNVFLDSYHSLPQVPTWKKERYSQIKIPANNLVDGWNLLDHRFKPKRVTENCESESSNKNRTTEKIPCHGRGLFFRRSMAFYESTNWIWCAGHTRCGIQGLFAKPRKSTGFFCS